MRATEKLKVGIEIRMRRSKCRSKKKTKAHQCLGGGQMCMCDKSCRGFTNVIVFFLVVVVAEGAGRNQLTLLLRPNELDPDQTYTVQLTRYHSAALHTGRLRRSAPSMFVNNSPPRPAPLSPVS